MGLMIFTLVVLCMLIVLFVYVFIALAKWPGKVARERGHAYPEAVAVLSWGGLLMTAGLAWLAALVWAHATPAPASVNAETQAAGV